MKLELRSVLRRIAAAILLWLWGCPSSTSAQVERFRLSSGQEVWIDVVREENRQQALELTETGKLVSTYGGDCVIYVPEPGGWMLTSSGVLGVAGLKLLRTRCP